MARGWESKSIESQIEDAERKQPAGPRLTPAEAEALRQKESLLLQRERILHDIDASRNPRYLEVLKKSLAYLEEQIARFNSPPEP